MKTFRHLWQYLAEFFYEWEIFQTKIVEKNKTHTLFWSLVFRAFLLQNVHNDPTKSTIFILVFKT
jgi:hypothetical protein